MEAKGKPRSTKEKKSSVMFTILVLCMDLTQSIVWPLQATIHSIDNAHACIPSELDSLPSVEPSSSLLYESERRLFLCRIWTLSSRIFSLSKSQRTTSGVSHSLWCGHVYGWNAKVVNKTSPLLRHWLVFRFSQSFFVLPQFLSNTFTPSTSRRRRSGC